MENATKALLIAGSVLIAILLIAMGIRIFSSTNGTTEATKTTMDATSVAMFNSNFTQYLGTNKSKSDVIQLVNKVIAVNASSNHSILMLFPNGDGGAQGQATEISNCANSLDVDTKYKISVNEYKDGYISRIKIEK